MQLLTLIWYFLEHVFSRYKSTLFPGSFQSTLMNQHIPFSASTSSNTRHKKSLQKVFLFPLVFMTLPDTLWFPSDSTCKLSQRVSGLFQHRKKIHFYKKKKDNKNPWWDSNFTLACLKVWEEAAKRHSRWQNSQQANVQIKKWEIRNTNVQRIGWNRLWNWVLNREKGPQNAPKHWRAAASGTAITRSPVWDGTEEIRKTSHHWSKRNV